jgi:hypothetical protein
MDFVVKLIDFFLLRHYMKILENKYRMRKYEKKYEKKE